jgi:MFS family permease
VIALVRQNKVALGFILPFFPLYLGELGVSDQAMGIIWSIAAMTSMLQLPLGRVSDKLGCRRLILLTALIVIALSGLAIPYVTSIFLLSFLVILFSENGIARSLVENLSGAEVSAMARKGEEGKALSSLRFFRPAGIVLVSLGGVWLAQKTSLQYTFTIVVGIQFVAILGILFMAPGATLQTTTSAAEKTKVRIGKDKVLWAFVVAMVLFHVANAPQGIYFGLYMVRDLGFTETFIASAILLDMFAWLLIVLPVGWLADRYGLRPLLFTCWVLLVFKTVIIATASDMWLIVFAKIIDGISNGMFAVLAALWMVARLGGRERAGEAHAIVGTSLVFGSALGPALVSFIVDDLGYPNLFLLLGAIAFVATLILFAVPEATNRKAAPSSLTITQSSSSPPESS